MRQKTKGIFYQKLLKKYRELIDRYEEILKKQGYKPSSVDTYVRKAAAYLYWCQERGLEPFDDDSLVLYEKEKGSEATRARFFLKKLAEEEEKKAGISEKEIRRLEKRIEEELYAKLKGFAEGFLVDVRRELQRELEKFKEELERVRKDFLAFQSKEELPGNLLVGKPIKVRTINGKTYSGELKLVDSRFLYIVVVAKEAEPQPFHKKKYWAQQQPKKEESVVRAVPIDVVETVEAPVELFNF
jgi:ElaB/YqjD/DUF883 family membrane-anchored ribosome-binding protein/small nuclear ribonucleoprotein (snRNP)-like protein